MLGIILVSIGRIAGGICYQGEVSELPIHNQTETTINAKKRIAGGLAAFKGAFTSAAVAA